MPILRLRSHFGQGKKDSISQNSTRRIRTSKRTETQQSSQKQKYKKLIVASACSTEIKQTLTSTV
jgi:hypothetical protein